MCRAEGVMHLNKKQNKTAETWKMHWQLKTWADNVSIEKNPAVSQPETLPNKYKIGLFFNWLCRALPESAINRAMVEYIK